MKRRELLKSAASGLAVQAAAQTSAPKMIGIQVGAVSFVDEGTEKVLDILQERAAVNTLFLATFTYGRGIAGRQIPGQPLPDHGKQEYDLNFHGGNYATVHPQCYQHTGIRPEDTRTPDHAGLDIVAEVLPKAKKRGLKVILWAEDVWRYDLAGIETDFYANEFDAKPSLRPQDAIRPRRTVWTAIWELPFGRGRKRVTQNPIQHLLGGWQLSWVYQYRENSSASIR